MFEWVRQNWTYSINSNSLYHRQIYARIVDQTVSREMDKLSAALSGTSFSLGGGEREGGEAAASMEETSN